jgi:hypothetical protein
VFDSNNISYIVLGSAIGNETNVGTLSPNGNSGCPANPVSPVNPVSVSPVNPVSPTNSYLLQRCSDGVQFRGDISQTLPFNSTVFDSNNISYIVIGNATGSETNVGTLSSNGNLGCPANPVSVSVSVVSPTTYYNIQRCSDGVQFKTTTPLSTNNQRVTDGSGTTYIYIGTTTTDSTNNIGSVTNTGLTGCPSGGSVSPTTYYNISACNGSGTFQTTTNPGSSGQRVHDSNNLFYTYLGSTTTSPSNNIGGVTIDSGLTGCPSTVPCPQYTINRLNVPNNPSATFSYTDCNGQGQSITVNEATCISSQTLPVNIFGDGSVSSGCNISVSVSVVSPSCVCPTNHFITGLSSVQNGSIHSYSLGANNGSGFSGVWSLSGGGTISPQNASGCTIAWGNTAGNYTLSYTPSCGGVSCQTVTFVISLVNTGVTPVTPCTCRTYSLVGGSDPLNTWTVEYTDCNGNAATADGGASESFNICACQGTPVTVFGTCSITDIGIC